MGQVYRLREPTPRPPSPARSARPELLGLESWGPSPEVESDELHQVMAELEADLHGLVDDIRRGPLRRVRADAQGFLGELRRAFLRHHRRLVVHVRAEGAAELPARFRGELAELAGAFRFQALSRSTRCIHDAWSPMVLAAAIDRILEAQPSLLVAPIEPETYRRVRGTPLLQEARRLVLVADRWIRRTSGDQPPTRQIELRSFLGFHVLGAEMGAFEGLAVLLVQAESHLESRARSLFEGIGETLEGLIAEPDDLAESLGRLRAHVEEELALAEQELSQFMEDLERRTRAFLAEGLREAKRELPSVGTFEVPTRTRNVARRASARKRLVEDVLERLEAARQVAGASYVLLGLRLELAAFRARTTQILEPEILDLERGVRGRSLKQIERVRTELDEAVEALAPAGKARAGEGRSGEERVKGDRPRAAEIPARPPEEEGPAEGSKRAANAERPAGRAGEGDRTSDLPHLEEGRPEPVDLEKLLENLRRVLGEAQRAAQSLVDQLTSEQALNGPLEDVAREASHLTDFYRVPVRRLAHTEWTLPRAPEIVEVPFAAVVATFIETDVAPVLLGTAASAAANLQPMLAVFAEVERVIDLGGGQLEGDDAFVRETPEHGETREVLKASFERVRDALKALEKPAEGWAKELVRALRAAARDRLEALDARLGEGGLEETVAAAQQGDTHLRGELIRARLGRIGGALEDLRSQSTRRVRAAVGEVRIAGVRRALGIPQVIDEERAPEPFEPPRERTVVPPFYRRLFAGQATWAGDLLEEQMGAARAAREALWTSPRGGLRTAVVLGTEGAGRRALLGALTRGDRVGQTRDDRVRSIRRIAFTEPSDAEGARRALGELSSDQLVVVTGFSWLVSAAPNGFSGLRALVEAILADAGKNAFLLEADHLVWRWAAGAAPLDDLFAARIEATPLGPRELESALLARHRLSGLDLAFGGSEPEEVARQRHFEALHRASDGLLQLALVYWLAALDAVDEPGGRVVVGAVPGSPHDAMRRLPEPTFHALYLVARQGWMTAEVLARVLGQRTASAEAMLARLVGLGLLERGAGVTYLSRRHLGGVLQCVLQERGWW